MKITHLKKIGFLSVLFWISFGTSLSITQAQEISQAAEFYAQGNYQLAAELWEKAAKEGSVEARFNLGVLYHEGKGVVRNKETSFSWFHEAAKMGHARAQYNLGHLLLEKQRNLEEVKIGVGWWKKAAENGSILAQYNYGKALFYGVAIDQDRLQRPHKSSQLLRRMSSR